MKRPRAVSSAYLLLVPLTRGRGSKAAAGRIGWHSIRFLSQLLLTWLEAWLIAWLSCGHAGWLANRRRLCRRCSLGSPNLVVSLLSPTCLPTSVCSPQPMGWTSSERLLINFNIIHAPAHSSSGARTNCAALLRISPNRPPIYFIAYQFH